MYRDILPSFRYGFLELTEQSIPRVMIVQEMRLTNLEDCSTFHLTISFQFNSLEWELTHNQTVFVNQNGEFTLQSTPFCIKKKANSSLDD